MHKGPKCIQTLWDHQQKIPFVEKYKECAICAILREKTSILGHTQRLKKVFRVLRYATNAPQRPPKKCKFLEMLLKRRMGNGEWGMGNEKLFSAVIPKNYAGVCAVLQRDEDCTW